MLVHGGHADNDHVGALGAVQLLAIVVQVLGEVSGHAGGMDLPEVAVIEEGLMMELVLQLGVGVDLILRAPTMHAGPQLDGVLGVDAVSDAVEVAQEQTGLGAVDGPDDAVAALDEADGIFNGAQLAFIDLLVTHAGVSVAEVFLVLLVLFQHDVGDVTLIVFIVLIHGTDTPYLLLFIRTVSCEICQGSPEKRVRFLYLVYSIRRGHAMNRNGESVL